MGAITRVMHNKYDQEHKIDKSVDCGIKHSYTWDVDLYNVRFTSYIVQGLIKLSSDTHARCYQ